MNPIFQFEDTVTLVAFILFALLLSLIVGRRIDIWKANSTHPYGLFGLYVLGVTCSSLLLTASHAVAVFPYVTYSVLTCILVALLYPVWSSAFQQKSLANYALLILISYLSLGMGSLTVLSGLRQLSKQHVYLEDLHEDDKAALTAAFIENMSIKNTLRAAKVDELNDVVRMHKDMYEKLKSKFRGVPGVVKVLSDAKVLNNRLRHTAYYLVDLVDRAEYVTLALDRIETKDLLQHVSQGLEARGRESNTTVHNHSKTSAMQCDVSKIVKTLLDAVDFMREHTQEQRPIRLVLEDTHLCYPIHSIHDQAYVKETDALRFTITIEEELAPSSSSYTAKLSHKESSVSTSPHLEEAIAMSKRVVSAHYGYWEISPRTLVYVVPTILSQVRPKEMDLLAPSLHHKRKRADDTYPGAKEAEAALVKAIAERSKADLTLVHEAIELIKDYHGPVKRKGGEPYYLHPVAAAHIVLDCNQDEATILAALLHDTVEDTELSLDQVEARFGKEVRDIVDGVTHLDSAEGGFHRVELSDEENRVKLSHVKDKRALYVKIADRTHNMTTIRFKKYASQLRKAKETMEFFVPMCKELGLPAAARRLEDLCGDVFKRGIDHKDKR